MSFIYRGGDWLEGEDTGRIGERELDIGKGDGVGV